MENLRKVEYYASDRYDPNAGHRDGGEEGDNDIAIGLFHRFADSYHIDNGTYYPLTEAIIEEKLRERYCKLKANGSNVLLKTDFILYERFC